MAAGIFFIIKPPVLNLVYLRPILTKKYIIQNFNFSLNYEKVYYFNLVKLILSKVINLICFDFYRNKYNLYLNNP